MKYANGFTCLCTALACSGMAMAQGNGLGFSRGAPNLWSELPSHSLYMEIRSPSGLVDDAVVTAMTLSGTFKQADLLSDGTYYVHNGIGNKTVVNIESPSNGPHSVTFEVPATPSLAPTRIIIVGDGTGKAISVGRREISGRPNPRVANTVS